MSLLEKLGRGCGVASHTAARSIATARRCPSARRPSIERSRVPIGRHVTEGVGGGKEELQRGQRAAILAAGSVGGGVRGVQGGLGKQGRVLR